MFGLFSNKNKTSNGKSEAGGQDLEVNFQPKLASMDDFSGDSRVWFYIANGPIPTEKHESIARVLQNFTTQWTAHNVELKAATEFIGGRIVLIMVDEQQTTASGCSIDKSVNLLKQLGAQLGVDFFDPFTSAWIEGDCLRFGNLEQLKKVATQAGSQLQVVNSQVKTKYDLEARFIIPIANSWQNRFI